MARGFRRGSQSGHLLIELVLVIVILGVLAAVAAPRVASSLHAATSRSVLQDLERAVRAGAYRSDALDRPLQLVWNSADRALSLENPDGLPTVLERFTFPIGFDYRWSQNSFWLYPDRTVESVSLDIWDPSHRVQVEILEDGSLQVDTE